jgi:hypothetical protein
VHFAPGSSDDAVYGPCDLTKRSVHGCSIIREVLTLAEHPQREFGDLMEKLRAIIVLDAYEERLIGLELFGSGALDGAA